ncbi:hypothetical protein CRG98_038769 [Punica granatum]|uniref:Uncharacterized protein n=1 Tax=Punica granatum TaxID=22663 RepID=A0A2I0IAP3_PUNGR|nr:hypothetical protein CRG98_038769 [Punica granatum]
MPLRRRTGGRRMAVADSSLRSKANRKGRLQRKWLQRSSEMEITHHLTGKKRKIPKTQTIPTIVYCCVGRGSRNKGGSWACGEVTYGEVRQGAGVGYRYSGCAEDKVKGVAEGIDGH